MRNPAGARAPSGPCVSGVPPNIRSNTMTELCAACDTNPPFVQGMSLCRQCLKARVDADRPDRERSWARQREQAAEAQAKGDWQKTLWKPRLIMQLKERAVTERSSIIPSEPQEARERQVINPVARHPFAGTSLQPGRKGFQAGTIQLAA